jgi:hypothetical protein
MMEAVYGPIETQFMGTAVPGPKVVLFQFEGGLINWKLSLWGAWETLPPPPIRLQKPWWKNKRGAKAGFFLLGTLSEQHSVYVYTVQIENSHQEESLGKIVILHFYGWLKLFRITLWLLCLYIEETTFWFYRSSYPVVFNAYVQLLTVILHKQHYTIKACVNHKGKIKLFFMHERLNIA